MNLRGTLQMKLIIGFLLIIVPIIMLLVYQNTYASKVIRNQMTLANENKLALYMGQIDYRLLHVDDYLYNLAAKNTDLLKIEIQSNVESPEYYFTKINLEQKLSDDIQQLEAISSLFIYSIKNNDLIAAYPSSLDDQAREQMQQYMYAMFNNDEGEALSTKKWTVRSENSSHFLSRVVKIGDIYVGAWTNIDNLMTPLEFIHLGENGQAFFVDEQYRPIDAQSLDRGKQPRFPFKEHDYRLVNDSLVIGAKSQVGNFSLVAIIPEESILEGLPYFQTANYLILMIALIMLPILYLFLHKTILLPINRIMTAMQKIKVGKFDTRLPREPKSIEFDLMNGTFNDMVSDIQKLKIDVYEETLRNQKAELNHLQLQMNPHFFLNSLNIIYSLAQVKDYRLIQEMTICLIRYFRFMFRSNLDYVLLNEEVEHTINYLKIQQLRFPTNLSYEMIVDEGIKECSIPPLVIQTFVENSIKYAVTMDDVSSIRIYVQEIAGHVRIIIEDSGPGFTEEVLAAIKHGEQSYEGSEDNLGIWNVRRRLELLYKDQASIHFSNLEPTGARIEINIPIVSLF